ncbi:MAG TPA: M56 family metallopeptidase [Rhizomicrobium sp.]|jgi:beta-lactamase regulating signal transducer with metallopeptidase domain
MIAALLDHIWQSTLFAGAAGLLTLICWRNAARVRFALWFAASLKFLVPFSALAALGAWLFRQFPATIVPPPHLLAIQPAALRLSAPARMLAQGDHLNLTPYVLALWAAGFGVIVLLQLARWLRLRQMLENSHNLPVAAPVDVKASPSLLEPGLVGILRPVVLLPHGLLAHLSQPQMRAILDHELTHHARRDNLTAAIHMLVEALFWFWPPVRLIGSRLITERERACDENVVAAGHDPQAYAEGILKVCKFCLQSPLACVPGASGADLGRRVEWIMAGDAACELNAAKRTLLAASAVLALGVPVMAGFLSSPLADEMQRRAEVMRVQISRVAARVVVEPLALVLPAHIVALPPKFHIARPDVPEPAVSPTTVPPATVLQTAAMQIQPVIPSSPIAVKSPAPVSVGMGGSETLKQALVMLSPTGEGDPGAVTCRVPQTLPGSRLPGPEVCKTNRVWAQLRSSREVISPDGRSVIASDARSPGSPVACNTVSGSSTQATVYNLEAYGRLSWTSCR